MTPTEETVVKLLDPILNVFGGADGGVAFSTLRHGFMLSIVGKENRTVAEENVLVMVQQFSRLCQFALDGKLDGKQ